MLKNALVWACLACGSFGHGPETAAGNLQADGPGLPGASGAVDSSNALAKILLAHSAAAAFKPAGHGMTPSLPVVRTLAPQMRTPQVPYKYPAGASGAGYRYDTTYTSWIGVYDRIIRERIVFVNGYMNDQAANYNIGLLLYLQNEDASRPVNMYCNIAGGVTKSGLAVYDAMRLMPFDIQTLNMGICGEVGAFIVAGGTKGQRLALPNSLFNMRATRLNPPVDNEGKPQQRPMQATEMKVEVEEVLRDKNRMLDGFAQFTGQPKDKLVRDFGRDFYLTAPEALEYGLVDKLLPNKKILTP